MDENQDCREEVINKLAVWATSGIDDVREAKCDLYLLFISKREDAFGMG